MAATTRHTSLLCFSASLTGALPPEVLLVLIAS